MVKKIILTVKSDRQRCCPRFRTDYAILIHPALNSWYKSLSFSCYSKLSGIPDSSNWPKMQKMKLLKGKVNHSFKAERYVSSEITQMSEGLSEKQWGINHWKQSAVHIQFVKFQPTWLSFNKCISKWEKLSKENLWTILSIKHSIFNPMSKVKLLK